MLFFDHISTGTVIILSNFLGKGIKNGLTIYLDAHTLTSNVWLNLKDFFVINPAQLDPLDVGRIITAHEQRAKVQS